MFHDPVTFQWTVAPGDSQFAIVLDSTRWPSGPVSSAAIAAGSSFLAPGKDRGFFGGCLVRYTVSCTGQNVTALDQILTGNAGTSADWETQGAAGTHVITAAVTQPIEFKPLSRDFRIKIDAGATGPTTLVVHVTVLPTGDFGS